MRPGRDAVVEIILEASGSMEGEAITLAKVACIRLLEALRAVTGVKASLTIFPGPKPSQRHLRGGLQTRR